MSEVAVLWIGDDEGAEAVLREAAEQAAVALHTERSLGTGLGAVAAQPWRATFLLLDADGGDEALVERLAAHPYAGPLILVARIPSLRLALAAPRMGAAELLHLPLDVDVATRAISAATARAVAPWAALPDAAADGDELVGTSPPLMEVFKAVGRVARSDATVLVTGESGTGKELVARALHDTSRRAGGPFVAVNCAAIPEDLLESELFGHERGAFTGAIARKVGRFERAHGGTLFLDEIGDMSLVLQAKILRALQERVIERLGGSEPIRLDVRVAAATHRHLPDRIAAGEFREDLYYRLAVIHLHLPPLRDRPGDVRALALHYAARFARAHARPLSGIDEDALAAMERHPWPGNVRELRNVVERAVLLASGELLLPEHLQLAPGAPAPTETRSTEVLPGYVPDLTMAQVEALHLRQVLRRVDGHFGRAGELLGMHRNTVSRKAQEYGLL